MTVGEKHGVVPRGSWFTPLSLSSSLTHMVHNIIQTLSHVWTKGQSEPQGWSSALFLRCRTFFNTVFLLQEKNEGKEGRIAKNQFQTQL